MLLACDRLSARGTTRLSARAGTLSRRHTEDHSGVSGIGNPSSINHEASTRDIRGWCSPIDELAKLKVSKIHTVTKNKWEVDRRWNQGGLCTLVG